MSAVPTSPTSHAVTSTKNKKWLAVLAIMVVVITNSRMLVQVESIKILSGTDTNSKNETAHHNDADHWKKRPILLPTFTRAEVRVSVSL